MDWMEEVKTRLGRKNQVLFSKDSPCLQDLRLLLQDQDRRLLILWALDFAEESAADLKEKYPAGRSASGRQGLGLRPDKNAPGPAENPGLPRLCKGDKLQRGYRRLPRSGSGLFRCAYRRPCHGLSHL